jgi:hypothetical protein
MLSTIKQIELKMREKGRTDDYIQRYFSVMRRISRYGKALKINDAREVAETLAEMRFKTPAKRQTAPTREQVFAIVAAADAHGMPNFACGILLQFWFALRAVDVRGQWIDLGRSRESNGGIVRNGKRWQDGLTWDIFDPELTKFQKVISKTEKTLPEPYGFDLTPLPELQSRLRMLRPENAVGPVIRATRSNGLPYTRNGWAQAWRRFREIAEVPEEIKMMDTRAAAVTEAKRMNADPYALRDAAQHADISTTNRYARDRSDGANKVVKLRVGAK